MRVCERDSKSDQIDRVISAYYRPYPDAQRRGARRVVHSFNKTQQRQHKEKESQSKEIKEWIASRRRSRGRSSRERESLREREKRRATKIANRPVKVVSRGMEIVFNQQKRASPKLMCCVKCSLSKDEERVVDGGLKSSSLARQQMWEAG